MSTQVVAAKGRSILVAVEPVMLEGALALLIERAHKAEVVEFHATGDALSRRYDAAVVSCAAAQEVQADVVITLVAPGVGAANITRDGTKWVLVESHHEIIQLLVDPSPLSNGRG